MNEKRLVHPFFDEVLEFNIMLRLARLPTFIFLAFQKKSQIFHSFIYFIAFDFANPQQKQSSLQQSRNWS
jgi:hypothetical protein